MEAVLTHLQANYVAYLAGIVCLLPLIFLTRRYSVPIIFYTCEIVAYLIAMHVLMWLIVVMTKWFKENSSMRALGDPERAPDWQTPLLEFWMRDQYNPPWVFHLEWLLALLIFVAVWRWRPPKVKRRAKRGAALEREKAARAMNPRYHGSAGGGSAAGGGAAGGGKRTLYD